MFSKNPNNITIYDIKQMITDQVSEDRYIDYKRELPVNSDDGKREFLADVSSFANAYGGYIFIGITEEGGIPQETVGLNVNIDDEILRLESSIREGITPRIVGIQMIPVKGGNEGPVLVVHIPKSWSAPHMVTFKNYSRFYIRNSAGKHQMDIVEIRSSFALSESLPDKIRRFRDERLCKIIARDTPVQLSPGPTLILHIIPLSAFTIGSELDMKAIGMTENSFSPIKKSGYQSRFNIDGRVTFYMDGTNSSSYCQVFRRGEIEAANTNLFYKKENANFIHGVSYEKSIIDATTEYINTLINLSAPYPFLVMMSMTDALGCRMDPSPRYYRNNTPIDRQILQFPDILLEDDSHEISQKLRPIFDAVWNACGYERSHNFDEKGNWNPNHS